MEQNDALRQAKFGGGLYLKEFPAKIRVLTLDPIVSLDSYGNTRYSFVVYNLTTQKAQVLSKGASFAEEFQRIHLDEDLGGDIRKVDIKITSTGTGKETRYKFTALPNAEPLTNDQVKEAQAIDLVKAAGSDLRLSAVNNGARPTVTEDGDDDDTIADVNEDEPINLDDIPF